MSIPSNDTLARSRIFRTIPHAVRFCEHFLEIAKPLKSVKWGLSKELARFYDSESQLCLRIAQRIGELRYFEGFVAVVGVIQGHAWLVDETGEVIDPTLILHRKLKEKVKGYQGVEISMHYINRLFNKDQRRDTRIARAFADGQ